MVVEMLNQHHQSDVHHVSATKLSDIINNPVDIVSILQVYFVTAGSSKLSKSEILCKEFKDTMRRV